MDQKINNAESQYQPYRAVKVYDKLSGQGPKTIGLDVVGNIFSAYKAGETNMEKSFPTVDPEIIAGFKAAIKVGIACGLSGDQLTGEYVNGFMIGKGLINPAEESVDKK